MQKWGGLRDEMIEGGCAKRNGIAPPPVYTTACIIWYSVIFSSILLLLLLLLLNFRYFMSGGDSNLNTNISPSTCLTAPSPNLKLHSCNKKQTFYEYKNHIHEYLYIYIILLCKRVLKQMEHPIYQLRSN